MADDWEAIAEWQRRLKTRPRVFVVFVSGPGGAEPTGNYYDSREAAQHEVDWYKRTQNKTARVSGYHMHDERLSRERWAESSEGGGAGG